MKEPECRGAAHFALGFLPSAQDPTSTVDHILGIRAPLCASLHSAGEHSPLLGIFLPRLQPLGQHFLL